MSRGSLSVTFKDGEVWAPAHLNQASVAFLLMQLFRHNFLINDRLVFPSLDIEKATWARVDSTPATKKKRKVHMYRIRAKGLAMEVLCGLLLAGLDSPEWVRNHAKARDGLPSYFAGVKRSDIEASYRGDRKRGPFRIVAEVSAKREVTKKFYRKQLNQAWRHANKLSEKLREQGIDEDVYALLINGGSVLERPVIGTWFQDFSDEVGNTQEGPVRVIPLYAPDLAVATRRIVQDISDGALDFSPSLLGTILDELMKLLLEPNTMSILKEKDVMCELWVKSARDAWGKRQDLFLGRD